MPQVLKKIYVPTRYIMLGLTPGITVTHLDYLFVPQFENSDLRDLISLIVGGSPQDKKFDTHSYYALATGLALDLLCVNESE